jgi:hypothetical protein
VNIPSKVIRRTPEIEREIDRFVAEHHVTRGTAWARYFRIPILHRLRAQAQEDQTGPAETPPSVPLMWGPVTCPHCAGFPGTCCRCQGKRLVPFRETLCTWIWAVDDCMCETCQWIRASWLKPMRRTA